MIYSPTYQNPKVLIKDIQSINGIPQTIYKIPLKDVPEEGLFGIQLNELVERVIIGPAKFPYIVKEALIEILNSKGVKSAADRIFVSDIPLRQIE